MTIPNDTSFTQRRATDQDADQITALVDAAYQHWAPVLDRTPLPMLADYRDALRQHRFDVLECKGHPTALIETDLREIDLLIINVAVHPDYQGNGLGRRLLDHTIQIARAAQKTAIRLYRGCFRYWSSVSGHRR